MHCRSFYAVTAGCISKALSTTVLVTEEASQKGANRVHGSPCSMRTYHKGPTTFSCLLVKRWKPFHPRAHHDHAVCACIIVGICVMEDKARSYLQHIEVALALLITQESWAVTSTTKFSRCFANELEGQFATCIFN